MLLARLRRWIDAHRCIGCVIGLWLVLLHPFISAHFHSDGLEDEPGLKVRNAGETVRFEPDERAGHAKSLETTMFAQASCCTVMVNALSAAFDGFMGIVLALLPLTIVVATGLTGARHEPPRRIGARSGAPPLPRPWLRLPPTTAPPSFA
jgi:hypothetical protein